MMASPGPPALPAAYGSVNFRAGSAFSHGYSGGMKRFSRIGIMALPILLLVACGSPGPAARGDANSIIVVAPDSLWAEAGPRVREALERPITTVREERTFDLTMVSPDDPALERFRLWRQVLFIGRADDPRIERVLERAGTAPSHLPAIVEADDLWARGQMVTAVVLPPAGGAEALIGILPELHALLERRFREYVVARMFVSGRNDSLRSALRAGPGFGLVLPRVYEAREHDHGTWIFRNDQSVTGELARVIQVTWRDGAGEPSLDDLLEWRDEAAATHYFPPQRRHPGILESSTIEVGGAVALEARGAWEAEIDGFPLAGPFITRAIVCPAQDRTYLLDAWLYAPGHDSRYEYMLQLETVLSSFECGRQ